MRLDGRDQGLLEGAQELLDEQPLDGFPDPGCLVVVEGVPVWFPGVQ